MEIVAMKINESSTIAEYIGFSAPETPKLLVLNNFLSDFFEQIEDAKIEYSYKDFNDFIVCQESDEEKREKLIDSFNYYFSALSGKNILSKKTKKIYFPLNLKMLVAGDYTLRHLHFQLFMGGNNIIDISAFKEQLADYLYSNSVGTNKLLSFIWDKITTEATTKKTSISYRKDNRTWFNNLSKKFYEDIMTMINSENYKLFDYYKKADYLSTLLSFYVILYIVERTNQLRRKPNNVIVCKGSYNSTENKMFHRMSVKNFANIRERIFTLYDEFLIDKFSFNDEIKLVKKDDEIFVVEKEQSSEEENHISFEDFVNKHELIRSKNMNTNKKLISIMGLDSKSDVILKNDVFVSKLISFLKAKKGSNIIKIVSTLSSTGRDIDFVFPRNKTKHKFFAMSEQMADFFVRLYLTSIDSKFADYSSFLIWLEERYNICIKKSEKLDKYLKNNNLNIYSKEYYQNEKDFIEILERINVLLKISDSGYIIILPELKGGFNLI